MWEEIERLEDDAYVAPDRVLVDARRGDVLAPQQDPAPVDRFEQVHTAKQSGLARSRRADEADDLVGLDGKVDPAQHLEGAE